MLDPAEKKEIIDGIRYEFKTFKDDVFKPIADAVKSNTDKTADQGEDIAENRGHIQTLQGDVKENRGSIGRLFIWIIGVLVTFMGALIAMWATGV